MGDDPSGTVLGATAGQKALLIGSLTRVVGGILGLVIGAITKKRFHVNGQYNNFRTFTGYVYFQSNRLDKYLIWRL